MKTQIHLSKYEMELLRLCKGRYKFKKGTSTKTLLIKFYKKHYSTYRGQPEAEIERLALGVMFGELYNLHFKIGENIEYDLKTIFYRTFSESVHDNSKYPLERANNSLVNKIKFTAKYSGEGDNKLKRFKSYFWEK